MTVGQSVTGSIGRDAVTPPWRFYGLTVSANDQVSIRATKTGGDYFFTPYLELYAPNGSLVTNAAGQIDATLAVAGAYLLIVRDENTAEGGTYTLIWERLQNPANVDALAVGQSVTGSIGRDAVTPPWRFYGFTVSANDQVSIRATKTGGDYFFNPYLELYAPNGSIVTNAAGQIDATLAVTGTYLLIVRDDNTAEDGTYTLIWERMQNPANISALTVGQSVTGSIGRDAVTPPWRFYSFTASANDQVSIRATKTGGDYFFSPYLELYAPNGSLVTNAAGQIDATLAVTGPYLLIVRDDNTGEDGTYTLMWERLQNPANVGALTVGQSVNGSIGRDTVTPTLAVL